MKILMTSDTFLPSIGGAEIHVKNLIDKLTTHGHQVTLLTTETELSEFDRQNIVRRTSWGKLNIFRILKILWKESRGANIIHCHYSYKLATLAGIIGRLRIIPVIVTLHGLGTLDQPEAPFVYKLAHSVYRYSSLKLSTHVISTSEDLAQVAYDYIPRNKITVIFNGYDEESFNPDVKLSEPLKNKYAGKRIILTVRRLVPKNGIHFLVESLPFVIKKIPDVVYLMAGEGRMRKYIEERINELEIEKNVEMLGEVDNKDVPQFLKLADVVVFPSTAESSSIACAEAMALGKPVVASRVGGLVEILGEHNERGILVDLVPWTGSDYAAPLSLGEDRYQALAQAIINAIVSSQSGVKEKGKQIAKYSKDNLSWTVISQKTEQVYKKFLKTKKNDNKIRDFYTGYSDKITEKRLNSPYKLRRYVHMAQYESILAYVEPKMKVLDAGCGEGTLSIMMARKGAIVTGCDISRPNIDNAIAYAKENGLSNIDFVLGDAEDLPFSDNEFDIVVSSHVLEHLPDFDRGLRELMRVSKKRAVVAIPTILNPCSLVQVGGGWFYLKGLRSFIASLFGLIRMLRAILTNKEGVDETYGGVDVPHIFRFPSVMKKKIHSNNFKLIGYEASSICLPYFEFLLSPISFLDKYKSKKVFRNLGYGTTFIVEK